MSEKRYFKIYSQRHTTGSKNNYSRLFDAVNKQGEYNEEAIKRKFRNESFAKQIHVAKNYLYNLIVNCLNEYHHPSAVNLQMREMLNSVEILFHKGLYHHASKVLSQLKEMAYQYEKNLCLLEIIEWENKIIFAQSNMSSAQRAMATRMKEEEELLKKYQEERQYRNLSDKITLFLKTKGKARSPEDIRELEKVMGHPILNAEDHATSYNTKYSFFYAYSKFFLAHENFEKALPYCTKLVALIESHPEQIEKNPRAYITAMNNLLNVLTELRQFERMDETLNKLKNVHAPSPHVQSRVFSYCFIHEWNFNFFTCQFQNCIALVPELENGLKKFEKQITKDIKILFCFNIFHVYFVLNDYQKALKWLNLIINDKRTEMRQDIRSISALMQVIVHFEKKETDLVEYLIRSAQRNFEKDRDLHRFELIVLSHLKKLIACATEKELRRALIALRNKLLFMDLKNYLTAVSDGSFDKIISIRFDILSWLESKIENRPFAELLMRAEEEKKNKFVTK